MPVGFATLASKRLCLVSAHFPPDLSGDGDYTYFLANALAGVGCQVEVLTAVGEIDTALYPSAPGVRVHRVVTSWGVRGLPHILRSIQSLGVDVVLIQYAPHAFHPRGITFAINVLPLLLRVTSRVRVIVNFHELFIPFDRSLKHCLGSLWQRAMVLVMAAPSHVLMATSSEWSRRLRQLTVWKLPQVVPVGSSVPRAEVSPTELKIVRENLEVHGSTLLVGCFGSASPHRDVELLRQAVGELNHGPPVKVVWLGKSGLEVQPLSRLSDEAHVTKTRTGFVWTGPLPYPQISRIMAACDVFALPFADGVSMRRGTLAAALLHGLPIITTRGKRLDDMFIHRTNLYLVPSGNARAFAAGLSELARDPTLRAHIARGAQELHASHFAWDVIARRVARLVAQS